MVSSHVLVAIRPHEVLHTANDGTIVEVFAAEVSVTNRNLRLKIPCNRQDSTECLVLHGVLHVISVFPRRRPARPVGLH